MIRVALLAGDGTISRNRGPVPLKTYYLDGLDIMQKETGLLCVSACVAGALGLFARWMQLGNSFEQSTGLPIKGSFWNGAVFFICALTIAVLAFLSLRLGRYEAELSFREAFRGRNLLYPLLAAIFGIVMIVGGVMVLLKAGNSMFPAMQRLFGALAMVSGVSLPVIAMGPKKDSNGLNICVATIIPVVLCCFWLLVSYRENSADPTVWHYSIEILAIAAAVMAYYYVAGYAFLRPRPKLTVFFCLLAGAFCIITLADSRAVGEQLLFAATGLMLISIAGALIANFTPKKGNHEM